MSKESPSPSAKLSQGPFGPQPEPDSGRVMNGSFRLTKREFEVLRLMAGGLRNKEIARALSITEGTVKNHVHSILSKLAASTRTGAIAKALTEQLL